MNTLGTVAPEPSTATATMTAGTPSLKLPSSEFEPLLVALPRAGALLVNVGDTDQRGVKWIVRRYDGAAWGSAVELGQGYLRVPPRLRVNASGLVVATWLFEEEVRVAIYDPSADAWRSQGGFPTTTQTTLVDGVIDEDGNATVAWCEGAIGKKKSNVLVARQAKGASEWQVSTLGGITRPDGDPKWRITLPSIGLAVVAARGRVAVGYAYENDRWPISFEDEYSPGSNLYSTVVEPIVQIASSPRAAFELQPTIAPIEQVPHFGLQPAMNWRGWPVAAAMHPEGGLAGLWYGACAFRQKDVEGECIWSWSSAHPRPKRLARLGSDGAIDTATREGAWDIRFDWTFGVRQDSIAAAWYEPNALSWATYDLAKGEWGPVRTAVVLAQHNYSDLFGTGMLLTANTSGTILALWDEDSGAYATVLADNGTQWSPRRLVFDATRSQFKGKTSTSRTEKVISVALDADGDRVHLVARESKSRTFEVRSFRLSVLASAPPANPPAK